MPRNPAPRPVLARAADAGTNPAAAPRRTKPAPTKPARTKPAPTEPAPTSSPPPGSGASRAVSAATLERVRDVIRTSGEPVTVDDIVAATGMSSASVRNALAALPSKRTTRVGRRLAYSLPRGGRRRKDA